ncbi:Tau class glutathione S-transferase [Dorcoceras hygrometricum]|uniref:Tau class glutathione S-transferase n=1 Tax=Dorcoceras hygrometricum TaxID=472368 RepID=A0A2Z7BDS2_9LAMI|nr:Tau class glutathione S-transferase [Dorcoceras hygrometricum]
MVKSLATSPHDPIGITDSACKNQLVVVSVQYGPFNTYISIRSTTIGKSRVAKDPIAMHISWRSNSDIASVTRISMMFRVVRTNQYNQDLGLIHSTNGNHLESPNEGSSIDHQTLVWFREAASRFSKAREEFIMTRRSMDGVLGRHDALMKQLEEIQTKENVEKESLSVELESARTEVQALRAQVQTMESQVKSLEARAQCFEEESKIHQAEVDKLQGEMANSWQLEKEKFLKSKEFDSLSSTKAAMYLDKGFDGCLSQFRANGYSEEEHPASFLDLGQALAEMSDDEDPEDSSSGREEVPPA